ncbi:hypothetical protein LP52_19350 [Streptomonospora alba]|uniref:DUF4282 domain-containing protein n=1 Tax=Streptomonospora alba TaxID=183763 RepID=A0A0C2JER4_9ACTN|nr:DUF4282 domain-containing protein [Streptomonospora alba]KIH97410.1 hypothetical protein LP52_19350 [Streptomonospora alba]
MNPPGENPYEPGRPDYSGQPGQDPSGYSNPAGYGGQPPQSGYPGQPGVSGPQQGWQQPPQPPYGGAGGPGGGAPGPGPAAPPPAAGPGFFAALFDFQFRGFVTTQLITVLFILWLVLIGIFTLSGVVSSFSLMAVSPLTGLLTLLGALVGGAVGVLLTRVGLEVLIVLFRISEDLTAIRSRNGM